MNNTNTTKERIAKATHQLAVILAEAIAEDAHQMSQDSDGGETYTATALFEAFCDDGEFPWADDLAAEVKKQCEMIDNPPRCDEGSEPTTDLLLVVRMCCANGNCSTCATFDGHTYGTPVRVAQYITSNREQADKVAKNWYAYGALVVPATEEEIAKLIPQSQAWAREKVALKHPVPQHVEKA